MGKLDGKVAVIAYAGGGIGKATAELLASEGAKVIIHDDADAKLAGIPGEKFIGDLRKKEDADKFIEFAKTKGGGKIDILVNNQDFPEERKKLVELTTEEFQKVVDMNLKTIWLTLAALYPVVKDQEKIGIKIINIGNLAGAAGTPRLVAYSSVKAGLYGLTKTVAKEWSRFPKVRCNMINAGQIKFPEGYTAQGEGKTAGKALSLNNPFSAVAAAPKDIANVVLFLASDASDAINAATIDAFGGIYSISGE
jgi:3-oxoacyl-[acyl-carrier protein] reductase